MNKKIFATALFAMGVFVSSFASAQNTFSNTVGALPTQNENAQVGKGGTSRANDLKIVAGPTAGDIPADSEIIVLLPKGLNFASEPTYAVTPATADQGLTLENNLGFGDPTLGENARIEMFDTTIDTDSLPDRAVVFVSGAGKAGDSLTISINVTASEDAAVGVKKASIVVAGGLAVSVELVEVIAETVSGVISATGDDLVTAASVAGATAADTSGAGFGLVIPAGAKNGDTVTFAVNGKYQFDTTSLTPTIVVSEVYTPGVMASGVSVLPLTGTAMISTVSAATGTITLQIQGAPATGFANDVVVGIELSSSDLATGGDNGPVGVTVSGTAGVAGTANIFDVKPNGSSAALAKGAKLTTLVSGSSSEQTLPDLTITENFDGDMFGNAGGSNTITITAGAGLTFSPTATVTVDAGATLLTATLGSTNTVWTLAFTANTPVSTTVTIKGLTAIAKSGTSGDLSVVFGGAAATSKTTKATDTVAVATSVPVGTVTVTGATGTLPVVGTTSGGTATFTLSETTYGSISRANYEETVTTTGTEITRAFFRVTPTNADITSVTISPTVYTVGTIPTFGPGTGAATGACGVESVGASTYICEVVTESTGLAAGTDTVTVVIGYIADGMVGDTISMSLDGNAGVAGSSDFATIVEATETKISGAIKVVKEGLTTAQGIGTFKITEKVKGALGVGQFRVIAPAGVVFATPYPASLGGGTATYATDTFAPNDTLIMSVGLATPSVTVTANVIVSSAVSGYISFDIVDGDIDAAFKTGLTADSLDLAYADKTLKALDAGSAVSVNAGFSKSDNVVTGGLIGDGYSVKSSNTGTVTVSLANVGGSQTLTITGVAAGNANVTVTDELGATDVVAVTVSAGAAIPAAEKGAKGVGDRTGVTFSAGATSDGGSTYGTTFTVDDEVTIIAVIGVDSTDVGSAGATHVAAKLEGNVFVYLDEDGNFADWDTSGLPGANLVTDSLDASYTVTVVDGQKLPAGEHRFALAYSTGDEVIYTGKAIVITITE